MLTQESVNDWRKFVGYNTAADGGLDFGAFGKTVNGRVKRRSVWAHFVVNACGFAFLHQVVQRAECV